MKVSTVQGRTLAYRDEGQGTPVLLFHGFPFTSEAFWPLLEAPPEGARLLVPDLPGFGRSAAVDGPALTMEQLADVGLGLLDALGLERAVVGGVSMGGYAALALTRLDPSRVQGLVLIDTQATADDAEGKARREATANEALTKGTSGIVETMLGKVLSPEASAAVRDRLKAVMSSVPAKTVAQASLGMGQRSDTRDVLSRFSGPALVVVGEKDPITPPAKAKQMAELVPGSTLLEVPKVGHLPQLEAPDVVREAMERWLAEHASR